MSTWLAQEYLFGGEESQVLFVGRGVSRQAMAAADCVVDVGNTYDPDRLWFDHKPPAFPDRNTSCATKLLWEWLLRTEKNVLSLRPLVQVTFEGDTRRWSPALKVSRASGPHAALNRYATECPTDDAVYARMADWLVNYASALMPAFGVWIDTKL